VRRAVHWIGTATIGEAFGSQSQTLTRFETGTAGNRYAASQPAARPLESLPAFEVHSTRMAAGWGKGAEGR